MCSTKILKYYHKNLLNGCSSQLTTYLGGIIMPLKHLILVKCYRGNRAYLRNVKCPALILICHLTLCKFHVTPNHLQLFCLFCLSFMVSCQRGYGCIIRVKFTAYLWYLLFVLSEQNIRLVIHLACLIQKEVGVYIIQCWGCPRSDTTCKCCNNNQRMQQEVLGFSGKLNLRLLFVTLLSC